MNDNPYKRMKKALKGTKLSGGEAHEMMKRKAVKDTGSFHGKSNKLGQGGRAAQLKAQGVPGGVIGNLARAAGAAPGQKNFHKKKRKASGMQNLGMAMKKKGGRKEPTISGGKKGDVEHKKKQAPHLKRKGTVSMHGDIEHKAATCMKCKAAHKEHAKKK